MLAEAQLTTINRRYILHEWIGAGSMGAVYSALDRLTGQPVALKRVLVPAEQLTFASLGSGHMNAQLALAYEFRTLASLRHPNIISVLDYGFYAEPGEPAPRPYFTMEMLEGAQTILKASLGQPITVKVDLLLQVFQALVYLHRRGILHRDLKPENALVAEYRVRVLDFGLSAGRDEVRTNEENLTGTLTYMAPELLRGDPTTEVSDLYAVGMMAYEVLSERYPFDKDNINALVVDILNRDPDLGPLRQLAVSPGRENAPTLAQVVGRLLAKTPQDRYQRAEEVITDLAVAAGQPAPQESIVIRESFLQTARFVGREAETSKLTTALDQALRGDGSAWLIGGESGVGKSRVLDELRAWALLKGATVLRGQAISEGGSPYHLWRPILRWLSLLTDLSDFEASVLSTLVPDISTLLDRLVPAVPELDSQVAQKRLLTVVEDLFRRQLQFGDKPIVLILEDLHWARESIDLLAQLCSIVHNLPLLILASYRDDESPDLPKSLPAMQTLKLGRLGQSAITELSAAILGNTGRQEQLVKLLQRETEGNVFFLVEVVRALAEDAGRLENIGASALPTSVSAGGIQLLIQRRLQRVPDAARPFLQTAAVAGRELDLTVLPAALSAENTTAQVIDSWLVDCANVAVLEVQENRWRFTHDKLRDGLLAELDQDKRRTLHQRLAQTMETRYGDAPPQANALAYHWKMAGDVQKEGHFSALAGEYALQSCAYQDAITFLERAAGVYKGDASIKLRRARWERQLGEAYIGLGQMQASRVRLEQCVALLGRPWPRTQTQLRLNFVGQVALQVLHRVAPGYFLGRSRDRAEVYGELARAYERINQIDFYANKIIPAMYSGFLGLNISEVAGKSPELVRYYAILCLACGLVSRHAWAEGYARRSLEMSLEVNDLSARSWALQVTSLYRMGVAKWDEVRVNLQQAIEISQRLGDLRRMGEMAVLSTWPVYAQGEFALALGRFAHAYKLGQRSGDVQVQAWALQGQAMCMMRMDRWDEALELVKTTKAPWVQALAHLRRGDVQLVQEFMESATRRTRHRPLQVYLFESYVVPAEVQLGLWEASPGSPTMKTRTRKACKAVQRYASIFPVGQPRAWLSRGSFEWLAGNPQRAYKLWENSLALAEKLKMPYDEALAHYEIGRHLETDLAARQKHLTLAADIFDRLGSKERARQAKEALQNLLAVPKA